MTVLRHAVTGLIHVGGVNRSVREQIDISRGRVLKNQEPTQVGTDVNDWYTRQARIGVNGTVLRDRKGEWLTFYEWWVRSGAGSKWLVLKDDRGWYILTDVTRTLRDENFRLHMFQPEFFNDRDAAIMAGVLRL